MKHLESCFVLEVQVCYKKKQSSISHRTLLKKTHFQATKCQFGTYGILLRKKQFIRSFLKFRTKLTEVILTREKMR